MIKEQFNERLIRLRKEKNLTQNMLSEILSISTITLSRYEAGTNYPDIVILVKMAHYFQVSADYLLGLSEYKNIKEIENINHDSHEYNEIFNNCDEIGKKDLIETSNTLATVIYLNNSPLRDTYISEFHLLMLCTGLMFSDTELKSNFFETMKEILENREEAIKAIYKIYNLRSDDIKQKFSVNTSKEELDLSDKKLELLERLKKNKK